MDLTRKIYIRKAAFLFVVMQLCCLSGWSVVRLPGLISDGMVLQRNDELKIWGWSSPSETIEVSFQGQKYTTIADREGCWHIFLPPQQAGGPYDMTINDREIKNILIGDVWLCSGQSNMETPVYRVLDLYKQEIDSVRNSRIRHFKTPLRYNFESAGVNQTGGEWKSAENPDILNFSALAYFFAADLYDKYHVPIGLLNVSVGGSPIEAWMSKDALRQMPHYLDIAQQCSQKGYIDSIQFAEKQLKDQWYDTLNRMDEGRKPPVLWSDRDVDISGWNTMNVPGYWSDYLSSNVNGSVWFRKNFEVPSSMIGKTATLRLGVIVDCDSVYINGQFIGTTSYQYPPRIYTIPEGVLKAGTNNVTVRVVNTTGRGGFVEDKPYKIIAENNQIDLSGRWFYKVGSEMPALQSPTFFQYKPLGLYNGMIAPVIDYKVKGVLWYQGESNTGRAGEYEILLTSLIDDWRKKWNIRFPFLYVQLPNFMKADEIPSESNWAMLREAQLKTLKVPDTGMAVAIDLGEWNDIHPLNKKEIGRRLSLLAQNIAYGDKDIVCWGPLFRSMDIDGKHIVISFDKIGSGLFFDGDKTRAFAIAGEDRHFVWANIRIEGNKVIVWHDDIKHPVAVRYAWGDNPVDANLRNREGLPASPFRTDSW